MNEFEHQPVVGVDAGPMKEEQEVGKGITCNKLDLRSNAKWVTQCHGFQRITRLSTVCVSFLGIFAKLLHDM